MKNHLKFQNLKNLVYIFLFPALVLTSCYSAEAPPPSRLQLLSSFLQPLTLTQTTYLVAWNPMCGCFLIGCGSTRLATKESENTVNAFTPTSGSMATNFRLKTRHKAGKESSAPELKWEPQQPLPRPCQAADQCPMSVGDMRAACSTQPSSRSVFLYLVRSFTLGKFGFCTHLWVWVKVKG